jgi:hypothetical protein
MKFDTLFGQCCRIMNISTNLTSAGTNIRFLVELTISLRDFPTTSRRRIHRRVLVFLIRRVVSLAFHQQASHNNIHMYDMRMLVHTCLNAHYFSRAPSEFNSRLSGNEKRMLYARMHTQFTHNLVHLLAFERSVRPNII